MQIARSKLVPTVLELPGPGLVVVVTQEKRLVMLNDPQPKMLQPPHATYDVSFELRHRSKIRSRVLYELVEAG